ncbi:hypothetical protein NT05LI_3009a, partial [Listeria ivanovii FSL F6-596]
LISSIVFLCVPFLPETMGAIIWIRVFSGYSSTRSTICSMV